jgi:hypothetical protein
MTRIPGRLGPWLLGAAALSASVNLLARSPAQGTAPAPVTMTRRRIINGRWIC